MNTETPDDLRDLLLHDIRTPLATVSGYAPLFTDERLRHK
jgi:hypothetical protein